MIYHPHFESYSIPARICLGIGIFGAALLAATVLTDGGLFQISKPRTARSFDNLEHARRGELEPKATAPGLWSVRAAN
jgi:hypothetical protein